MGEGQPSPFSFGGVVRVTFNTSNLPQYHIRIGNQVSWRGDNWQRPDMMSFAGCHRRGGELMARHKAELKSLLTYDKSSRPHEPCETSSTTTT